MDEIDQQIIRDERLLDAMIAVRKPEGPAANGRCLSCEEPLPVGVRWCDADCRDDSERLDAHPSHR